MLTISQWWLLSRGTEMVDPGKDILYTSELPTDFPCSTTSLILSIRPQVWKATKEREGMLEKVCQDMMDTKASGVGYRICPLTDIFMAPRYVLYYSNIDTPWTLNNLSENVARLIRQIAANKYCPINKMSETLSCAQFLFMG